MSIKKIVVASGEYNNHNCKLMVLFDESDRPVEIIELNSTKIGRTYLATVEKVLKDMDCSILKLDKETKGFIENKQLDSDKFVKYQTTKNKVSQGDQFYVKVSKDKKANKPYSCDFCFKDATNDFEIEFINTYFSLYEDAQIITDDPNIANCIMESRLYEDDIPLWTIYSFSNLLDHVLNRRVYLDNGANIVFDYAEAATVIDVNSANANKNTSAFEINCYAAKEIVRQIRLRNISGIIIIDFLKMSPSEETLLLEQFMELTQSDSDVFQAFGFTKLGLLEATRKRKMSPLHEIFAK